MPKTIFIAGNPDLDTDSLPLRILPRLRIECPEITFEVIDPNEDWAVSTEIILIDTVIGIEKVTLFSALEQFVASPRITMHDFDVLANIRLMKKLGKITSVTIIGIPPNMSERSAAEKVSEMIKKFGR